MKRWPDKKRYLVRFQVEFATFAVIMNHISAKNMQAQAKLGNLSPKSTREEERSAGLRH
jgi:hypothetical protein